MTTGRAVTDLTAALAEARRTEAEQRFGLRKTWIDPAPGIELVQLHYAWTRPGETAAGLPFRHLSNEREPPAPGPPRASTATAAPTRNR